jgi:mannose-1-phosphate guanylyltransferase
VLTADHVIRDIPVFQETIRNGLELAAREDMLITIGIMPTSPNTGYGYIDAGESALRQGGTEFLKVKRFVEKPDLVTAKRYCSAGHYYWNSGMFIWSVRSLEKSLAKHRPALVNLIDRVSTTDPAGLDAVLLGEYDVLEKISIDYALMEKAENIIMAKSKFAWDDVGSWTALTSHLPKDAFHNSVLGACEALDAEHNIVVSEGRLTALIGVKDLVVVQSDGVTLVCPKERAQDVKKLVERLKAAGKYGEVL